MSVKTVSPLEASENLETDVFDGEHFDKETYKNFRFWFDIIETALKRLEIIDRLNKKHCEDTQKKLKALEIIKDKQWFDDFMKEHLSRIYFTQYELDLLKEVLK